MAETSRDPGMVEIKLRVPRRLHDRYVKHYLPLRHGMNLQSCIREQMLGAIDAATAEGPSGHAWRKEASAAKPDGEALFGSDAELAATTVAELHREWQHETST